MQRRIPIVDGIRGVLASLVVVVHLLEPFHLPGLHMLGLACVMCFFVMSGYVLARAYDGRPLVFMARRVVRLWPVYAFCLTLGYAELGALIPVRELLWLPPVQPQGDYPAWSLFWEAWATLPFPLAFWVARRNRSGAVILAGACFGLVLIDQQLAYVMMFASGVAAAQFDIPWPGRTPGWMLWLGKISYSLYLTHVLIMRPALLLGGRWAVVASLPVVLLAAWGVWWGIERLSINWSRAIGGTGPAASLRIQDAFEHEKAA
jgi:peptidoglycan/LPS O-acetylase OafA/YrhL